MTGIYLWGNLGMSDVTVTEPRKTIGDWSDVDTPLERLWLSRISNKKYVSDLAKRLGCSVDALDFHFDKAPKPNQDFGDIEIPDMRLHS